MVERGEAAGVVLSSLDRLGRTLTAQDAPVVRAWRAGAEVQAADFGLGTEDDPDDPMRTAIRQMAGVFDQLAKSVTVPRLPRARQTTPPDKQQHVGRKPFGQKADTDREYSVLPYARARTRLGDSGGRHSPPAEHRPEWATRSGRPLTPQNLAKIASRHDA